MNYYIEDNLNIPLKKVLDVIQHRIMNHTTYLGITTLKNPIDFWVYQEIIYETKPDVIIEIGNYFGGSTLALANICDALGNGKVIGIDISHQKVHPSVRDHPRISLIQGDACQLFEVVKSLLSDDDKVLVIEDSAHTFDNTLEVLNTYSTIIKPGDYFIVEDSICHHGLSVGPQPGPYEAIETFIKINSNFEVDRSKESFFLTWNPKGFLKRKR